MIDIASQWLCTTDIIVEISGLVFLNLHRNVKSNAKKRPSVCTRSFNGLPLNC